MKLSKKQLKQLIEEEISYMLETSFTRSPLGVTSASRGPSQVVGTPQADMDKYADEPGLGDITTEPRHDNPYEAVWNKLLIRHKLEQLSPEAAAERLGLGGDEEVIEFIRTLQADKFYDPSITMGDSPTVTGGSHPG